MKKILTFLASSWLMLILLLIFAISIAVATFIESGQGTEVAWKLVYNAKWFELLLLLGMVNLSTSIFIRKLYRVEKLSIFIFHLAFVLILLGAGVTRYFGIEGTMQIYEGKSANTFKSSKGENNQLPFEIYLNDFIIDYYPGSKNPSGYESLVTLKDPENKLIEEKRIYMNNILIHRGYRFYQSSYTEDQKATILSVSRDRFGTGITYLGYFFLVAGMLFSLVNRNSRFVRVIKSYQPVLILFLVFFPLKGNSNDSIPVIPREQADKFGELFVRDEQGRTKPLNTLAEDVFRKVHRKAEFNGQNALQVLLGMYVYPEYWQKEKLVYAGTKVSQIIDVEDKYASLQECYAGQGFFISTMEAVRAYRIPPANRSKPQSEIIRFDERLNILYQWFGGKMLNIFPGTSDTTNIWYNPLNVHGKVTTSDSAYMYKILHVYFAEIRNANETGDWTATGELLAAIKKYQYDYGDNLPVNKKMKLERFYYKADIFKRISSYYFVLGFVLLVISFITIFSSKVKAIGIQRALVALIGLLFGVHTLGLAVRWIISGHAPWSDTYETMILIAWAGVLAGLIFAGKSKIAPAIAAILAWIFLFAGHMSWLDPQITNLVPVLKSKWLVIHVAVITSSYGFLAIGALMAFINLIMMSFQNKANYNVSQKSISNITRIIELTFIVGLYLLTIGTFLGAIWANVSWGRYWAWDPKETWALITILFYAVVLHLRLIPALNGEVLFNFLSVLMYGSVLMTYFGVNYYLSGLHSYATGDPAPIPKAVYYSVGILIITTLSAALNRNKLLKQLKNY